jgi:hypothetical protein
MRTPVYSIKKQTYILTKLNIPVTSEDCEPGLRSQYSGWLRNGRTRCRCSSPDRGKIFLLYSSSSPVLRLTQLPIQWVQGDLSPGIKRPGREADHSLRTGVEVKNTWIYTPIPAYVVMIWCLIILLLEAV